MKEPSEDEINEVLNRVQEKNAEGGTRYRGMTFEQGVEAGIQWVRGDTDENPYPEKE